MKAQSGLKPSTGAIPKTRAWSAKGMRTNATSKHTHEPASEIIQKLPQGLAATALKQELATVVTQKLPQGLVTSKLQHELALGAIPKLPQGFATNQLQQGLTTGAIPKQPQWLAANQPQHETANGATIQPKIPSDSVREFQPQRAAVSVPKPPMASDYVPTSDPVLAEIMEQVLGIDLH